MHGGDWECVDTGTLGAFMETVWVGDPYKYQTPATNRMLGSEPNAKILLCPSNELVTLCLCTYAFH